MLRKAVYGTLRIAEFALKNGEGAWDEELMRLTAGGNGARET